MLNGKVRCVKSKNKCAMVEGNIYEFKNGSCPTELEDKGFVGIESIEKFNQSFHIKIELVEETTPKAEDEIFQLKDRVWSFDYGWGIVINLKHSNNYPICVKFKYYSTSYTKEGKLRTADLNRSLFFQEIEIPKEALIRPRWRAKEDEGYLHIDTQGDIKHISECGYISDNGRWEKGNYFRTIKEAKSSKFYKVFHEEEK